MTQRLDPEEWEAATRDHLTSVAADMRRNPVLAEALDARAASLSRPAGWSVEDLRATLFLDLLSRRSRHLDIPLFPAPTLPPRVRCVFGNPTRFSLDAARTVGAVASAVVIAAVEDADHQLERATLGMVPDISRGRVDLASYRRFGADRDARLRPRVIPAPPILPASSPDVAHLAFLQDELEFDYVLMTKTGDRHLPLIAKFPIDHRTARALTGWTAMALDARLARGARWDSVLDAARIRTSEDRGNVVFDPVRFAQWWRGLMN